MKSLGIRELRKELGTLDELMAREGEVVVTRHGRAIARVVPVRDREPMPSHAELRASMPRLLRGSETLVRAERDER